MSTTGSNNLFTISLLVIPGLFLGACSQESPPTTSEPATSTRETSAETPAVSVATDSERRPNILVIIGDDMGSTPVFDAAEPVMQKDQNGPVRHGLATPFAIKSRAVDIKFDGARF